MYTIHTSEIKFIYILIYVVVEDRVGNVPGQDGGGAFHPHKKVYIYIYILCIHI